MEKKTYFDQIKSEFAGAKAGALNKFTVILALRSIKHLIRSITGS